MSSSLRSEGRRFSAISLVLLLFIPLTWGAREWSLSAVSRNLQDRQLDALTGAFDSIQDDFEQQQIELLTAAQHVAAEPAVRKSLAAWSAGAGPDDDLVRYMAALHLPERVAVEVYDPTPRLVAWNGFSMPLDDAPSRPRFLEGVLTSTVADGEQRTALVVWWPVRDGLRVVGVVRIIKLLEIVVPLENQYLRGFSQARIWSGRTRLPVRFRYDVPFDDLLPPNGEVRLLVGIDGSALGRVFIDRPGEEELRSGVRQRYDHVLAFWVAILALWLVFGIWRWYRAVPASAKQMRRVGRFLLFAVSLCGTRFLLIGLNVPARYQPGKAPLSPLFDPTYLASSAGWGLFRSTGDLLITAFFAAALAYACIQFAAHVWTARPGRLPVGPRSILQTLTSLRTWAHGIIILVVAGVITGVLTAISQSVILDSTLEYFARTGLLPEPLVVLVFTATLILTTSFVIVAGAVYRWSMERLASDGRVLDVRRVVGAAVVAVLLALALVWPTRVHDLAPVHVIFLFGLASLTVALASRAPQPLQLLTFRTVLPAVLLVTVIQYPLLYRGMQVQRQMRMVDAAASFEDWRDPRVQYAIEQVLQESQDAPQWTLLSASADSISSRFRIDSLISDAVRSSFLSALGSYEISVTVYRPDGTPVGRYYEVDPRLGPSALDELERLDLELLRGMYEESGERGVLVEPITDPQRTDRFPYYGVAPFRTIAGRISGWMVVRAEPRTLLREAITPFPRALVPAGFYGNLPGRLSVAVFRDGALVRSTGDDFAGYRLPDDVATLLNVRGQLWRSETVRDEDFYSYYQLTQSPDAFSDIPVTTVIAVRLSSINVFDHLYNLLRLAFGGLLIGLPVYVAGAYARRSRGLLPAPRVRFRDKILNAFLGVGVVTVALMGVVGLNVVTKENEREIEDRLRQHLERIERSLALDARGGEMTYRVLERTRIDSLAARAGLDINVFKENVVVASSRPQLVRDRLIDPRLPIQAYEDLYVDGFKFSRTRERLGTFSYTVGFRAIPDEEGRAHFVISVPTLPEQDEIEEERARTVAYLFGALLLLMVVVLVTASVLANALTRPIARLRDGIEAVARGRFNRIRPLDTRDEISELVDSFNTMQDQLGESRRRLARQERQLAWREMARQVAHEIKNPLTPMKLSVQHLRRSFERGQTDEDDGFASLFDRITSTLTEQIDALARIANEFSSFARMPRRVEESIDINSVVEEAVALMGAEAPFDIDLRLVEVPLIVQADREEVRRIFINLIKNALQSIPEDRSGQVSVTTRLDTAGDGSWAHVTVKDNGTGIPADLQDRIFVPNLSTKTSGAGLGLAIVRKSVEDLHGEIGFDTAEDAGTSFWIRMPLESVASGTEIRGPGDDEPN